MPRINRNTFKDSKKRMKNFISTDGSVDDVTDRARQDDLEQDRVDPTNVIGKKEKSSGGHMFKTECSYPINATGQYYTYEI